MSTPTSEQMKEFGFKLREALGDGYKFHVMRLSDALNVQKDHQEFLNLLLNLCVKTGVVMTQLLPDDKNFVYLANTLIFAMMNGREISEQTAAE